MCVCVGTKETVATITRQMPANVERRRQGDSRRKRAAAGRQTTNTSLRVNRIAEHVLFKVCLCVNHTRENIVANNNNYNKCAPLASANNLPALPHRLPTARNKAAQKTNNNKSRRNKNEKKTITKTNSKVQTLQRSHSQRSSSGMNEQMC